MAPSNQGYKFSEENTESVEPQKMSGPRGVDNPVVENKSDNNQVRQSGKSNIVDRGGQASKHPAFRSDKQDVKIGPNEEAVVGSAELFPDQPTPTPKDNADRFMGMVAKMAEAAKAAKVSMHNESFDFGSIPASTKYAIRVARRWQSVPDTVSDSDVLAQGIITPEMLQLILTIVLSMMQDCLPNQPSNAWRRIQNYSGLKPMDRLADDIRVSWLVDRWFVRMAFPRDKGDVRLVGRALADEAASSKEEDFRAVQTDMLFMTV